MNTLKSNRSGSLLAVASLLLLCSGARADEGGVPFWTSGQYASMAAVAPAAGWTLTLMPFYYNGERRRLENLPQGRQAGQRARIARRGDVRAAPVRVGHKGHRRRPHAQPELGGGQQRLVGRSPGVAAVGEPAADPVRFSDGRHGPLSDRLALLDQGQRQLDGVAL